MLAQNQKNIMKAQTFIDKRSIYLRRKSGNEEKSRQKRSLKSWLVEFVLTRKKVCAHDKKGFTSREKRFHLTSANSPLGFSPFHCLCSCARFRDFCLLIQALSALKDQPLGVGQALNSVKYMLNSVFFNKQPFLKTNPKGLSMIVDVRQC